MKAIKAGLLIDGNGGDPIRNGVVLVEDGKIAKIGPASKVAIPGQAEVFDAADKTVMPGMFDAHCHILMTTPSIEKRLFVPNSLEILQCGNSETHALCRNHHPPRRLRAK